MTRKTTIEGRSVKKSVRLAVLALFALAEVPTMRQCELADLLSTDRSDVNRDQADIQPAVDLLKATLSQQQIADLLNRAKGETSPSGTHD